MTYNLYARNDEGGLRFVRQQECPKGQALTSLGYLETFPGEVVELAVSVETGHPHSILYADNYVQFVPAQ